jgi:hypothetical protein
MSVRAQLLDMVLEPEVFDHDPHEIEAMQLEAARELFAERREQIPVLARRADEAGVTAIDSFNDLVPLLFSHTTYKSYPPAFIESGRWDRMLDWLNTLSVQDARGVDVDGVENVDQWLDRLRDAGHMVLATSGSSGKCSFLNQTVGDRAMKKRHFAHTIGWPYASPNQDREFFGIGPHVGYNSAIEATNMQAELWGAPGHVHFLTDEPLLIAELSRSQALRKRMGEGTAEPSEIAEYEAAARAKSERMNASLETLAERIIAARQKPIFLAALWAQHIMIIERARAMGVKDGEFHPQSIVAAGGGVKGVALPPDYKEQVTAFYGDVIRPGGYGMTEMAQRWPRCEAMRYHRPPGLIMLPLDRPGERLLTEADALDGVVEGRFAFVDLLFEGRWGGLISGDKVQIDFSGHCPCGRPGPTILDSISRYSQPGEDDHIGCAGTIDSYVRGAIAA